MFKISDGFDSWCPIQNHFPDGTLHLDNLDIHSVKKITWFYDNDAELFSLMCLREKYSDPNIVLSIPYLPHARMDRVQSPNDSFTLKVFCQAINALNFKQVEVYDVHSNVSLALLDRVVNISPEEEIRSAISHIASNLDFDDFVLFFPDEGAMKRYSKMSQFPYTFGIKDRDWQTGKIQSFNLMHPEMIKDKTVLIVDDICSRGGTFKFASEALKEAGAREIYLFVSHAENVMVEGEMYKSDIVKNIFTTNSIFNFSLDVRNKVIKV